MSIRHSKRKIKRSILFILFVSFSLTGSFLVSAQKAEEKVDLDPALLKSAIDYDSDNNVNADTKEEAALPSAFVSSHITAESNSTKAGTVMPTVKSPFTKSTYVHAGRFKGYQVLNGIDVSEWQGSINWNSVKKAGVNYAIIRIGYRGSETGALHTDRRYLTYIKGAMKAGIKVGVYIYSQATTESEARAEANFVINRIKGYDISMPVVLDYEFYTSTSGRLYKAHLTKRKATDVCKAFCKTVENAGYTPMVYGNCDMLNNHLYAEELAAEYNIWLANFGKNNGKDKRYTTSYAGTYSFWQYTSRGKVSGIGGYVDCNFWYKNKEATAISITDDSVPMMSNNKAYLYHSLSPAGCVDNITWTSSKPTVAYVKDGYVYGVSGGETTITATTSTGASDSCKIIVSENMNNYEITDIDRQVYTGEEVTPELTVRSKTKLATTGVTNKETAVFTGPDNAYNLAVTLKKNESVQIYGQVNGYYAISVKRDSSTCYGYCLTSAVKAQKAYKTLATSRDYTVKYSSNTNVGTALAEVSAQADSGYNGTISKLFTILQADMQKTQLAGVSDRISNANGETPEITVYYLGKTLTQGKDYTVNYQATNASTEAASGLTSAQAVVTGCGNFKGQAFVNYAITNDNRLSVDAISPQMYTGYAICPSLVVRDKNGQTLQPGQDYTVTYSNNIELGNACATVTSTGEKPCTYHAYYTIIPADLANAEVSANQTFTYQKEHLMSSVTVTLNGKVLTQGVDYNCQYFDNYKAGNATVKVSGIGNYTGSRTTSYAILEASIDKTTISGLSSAGYTGKAILQPFTLKDGNDTLVRGRDYTVSYKNNTKLGKASITITGIGNYTGTKKATFTIKRQSIHNCKIGKIGNYKYTGKSIHPKVTVRNQGKKLKKGKDYTVHYKANKSVGKATIVMKGKGNYRGSKTIRFRIVKR